MKKFFTKSETFPVRARPKTQPMTPREVELSQQLVQCQEALAAARLENQLLRQKLDALARRFFGVSSEALNPAQLQLLLQMPELKPVENPPGWECGGKGPTNDGRPQEPRAAAAG